ncbi:MAG: DUF2179 domain-containing protein [Candidatus Omnitrophica bacterium]|nr:DUF2179 domain-containing protein [Candidatus Omnitrophota bacterium]
MTSFFDSFLFTWILLPALIFFARIMDMSLDTLRIIMIGRGRKGLVALFGFVEVTIWLLVARQVITHLPNVACFFAYSGGFAAGNYVGMWIEERLAVRYQLVRMMVQSGKVLVDALKKNGYGVTLVEAKGAVGAVDLIYTIVIRSKVQDLVGLIETHQPKVFYTIEDVRYVSEGAAPAEKKSRLAHLFSKN